MKPPPSPTTITPAKSTTRYLNLSGLPVRLEECRSRALPGHRIWRLWRVGSRLDVEAADATFRDLRQAADQQPRLLRCYVQLFDVDETRRTRLRAAAERAGFRPRPTAESYTWTILLDTTGSEEQVFQRLGATARRHVRRALRQGLRTAPLSGDRFADRLREIEAATRQRNQAGYRTEPWEYWLEQAARATETARISGLFQGVDSSPENLIAFALGYRHDGDGMVEYRAAGNLRATGANLPLAYLPAWDLIAWTRGLGLRYFDFGGVPAPSELGEGADGPRARIAAFKRHFSKQVSRVAEELLYEPRPVRSRLAHSISTTAAFIRRAGGRSPNA